MSYDLLFVDGFHLAVPRRCFELCNFSWDFFRIWTVARTLQIPFGFCFDFGLSIFLAGFLISSVLPRDRST